MDIKMDFPSIATLFFSLGINKNNIRYAIKTNKQILTVKYVVQNNINFNLILFETIYEIKNNCKYGVKISIQGGKKVKENTNDIDLFYSTLFTCFVLLNEIIKATRELK